MKTTNINWLSFCPKCECDELAVTGSSLEQTVIQGDDVKCTNCGNKGSVVVYGLEECDVEWEEE